MDTVLADVDSALGMLLEKYSAGDKASVKLCENPVAGATHVPAEKLAGQSPANVTPVLRWRVERRFTELKAMTKNGTLGNISTMRFASLKGGVTVDELLYRELELCEWLGGSPVERLYAVASGESAVNVLAQLRSGAVASLEISNQLPAGCEPIDRHEIITTRGVASDRVVDTQVPQSSVYVFGGEGEACYRDCDAELYGMPGTQADLVRAAYAAIANSSVAGDWRARHERVGELLEAAHKSIAECRRVTL